MAQLVRILKYERLSGPENMAADETMLRTAADRGHASIRFYGWTEPTVSLGYFQPHLGRHTIPGLANLPWVRRSTGGGALVHHHELTYSLALPAGDRWHPGIRPWTCRIHDQIQAALQMFNMESEVLACGTEHKDRPFLCFQHHTTGDLVMKGHKIAGSAQRKQHGAILQHGGILLAQSEYTPQLPGIQELIGVSGSAEDLATYIIMKLIQSTGWVFTAGRWTDEEQPDYEAALAKFRSAEWNEKR